MIKFLQRVGHNFTQAFKEGYHAPMPEGGHGGVAGFLGAIIVGVPTAAAMYLAKDFFSKKSAADVATSIPSATNDLVEPIAATPTKSWAAAEQAKAEVASETKLTR